MLNSEDEAIRILLKWLLPTAISAAVIKIATKMLVKDISWTGAILTSIISILMGVMVGMMVQMAWGLLPSLIATSVCSLIGEKIGNWIVYSFEWDKAFNEFAKAILNKIKKWLS